MTRGDKLMLAGLLLLTLSSAAALYGGLSIFNRRDGAAQAIVTVGGKEIQRIKLSAGGRSSFDLHGRLGTSTLEVQDGRIRMSSAPCPGQVCVKQGWIERPGQLIACVPGEILVRIEGAAPLDAVTR